MRPTITSVISLALIFASCPLLAGEVTYRSTHLTFTYPDSWFIVNESKTGAQAITIAHGKDHTVIVSIADITTSEPDDGLKLEGKPGYLGYAFLQSFIQAAAGRKDLKDATISFGQMSTGDGPSPSCIISVPSPDGTKVFLGEAAMIQASPYVAIGGLVLVGGRPGMLDSSPTHMGAIQEAYRIMATLKEITPDAVKKPGWLK